MVIKQGPVPEFCLYAKCLEKIKRDVKKVICIAARPTSAEDRLDDIAPCIKRVLEQIVYGILGIQIPVYGRKDSVRRWQKSKAIELVKKVDPKFYPDPHPDRGKPYVKITQVVQDSDALTQEQWLTAWAFVNRIQHVQNPASERRKPDPQTALDDALKWTQRVVNLLSYHTVIAANTAFFAHVIMHPQPSYDAQVQVIKRVSAWSPAHHLPNGGSVKLQFQSKEGEWYDVEDPEEGGIALMELQGIYTHRGFQPG